MAKNINKDLTDGYIAQNLDSILEHYKKQAPFFSDNSKVFEALDDNYLSIVEETAYRFTSKTAQEDHKNMAIGINYIKKVTDHRTQLYTFTVTRKANSNQDLVDAYVKLLNLDSVFTKANYYANATFSVITELYINREGLPCARAVPNKSFTVYSDDIIEPNRPTAFIKVIRTDIKETKDGKKAVDLLQIWTDSEVMLTYADKTVQYYKVNWYNIAPFTYITYQPHRLIPASARDDLHFVNQVNNIFTGGVVNNHWLSNPIRVLKNVDDTQLKISLNPNDFLILNGRDGSQFSPEIDELSSTIDLDKSFTFASNLLREWLYTKNIKNKDAVQGNAESGISIALKDSDMLEDRKLQIEQFRPGEEQFWLVFAKFINAMIDEGVAVAKMPTGRFDDNFAVEVEFELPDTNSEVLNNQGEEPVADAPADNTQE